MEFKGTKKAEEYAKEKSSSSVFAEAHKKDFLVGYEQALKDSKATEMLEMLKRSLEEIKHLKNEYRDVGHCVKYLHECGQLIKEATEL